MLFKQSLLLASSVLVSGLTALPAASDDRGSTRGWYAGGFVGGAWPTDFDINESDTFSSDTGFAVGGILGKNVSNNVRVELEVSNWSADADCSGKCALAAVDVDALSILGNAWVDIPTGHEITPYIGGGIGYAGVGLDGGSVDETSWGFAWQVGAGLRMDVGTNMKLDIGYRYKSAQADGGDYNSALFAGDFDADAHVVQVGLIFPL
jgi:opacity protein-like surface antigen